MTMTIQRLSESDTDILIAGASAKAKEIGIPMCIAITDESGNLIAFRRMDGGKISSVVVAQDKAYTAAAARKATHEYNEVCIPGSLAFGIHTSMGGRLCVVGGGLPVIIDREVVGGIGLSSGTPQQDMQCAQSGLDQFERSIAEH
jgi:uncharacterized protein GlcG (DUF336 family)